MQVRFFIAAFVLLFTASISRAQAAKCPTLQLTSSDLVAEGTDIIFTINLTGVDANVTPTYNWTVSAGAIKFGQGTSTIKVDSAGLGDQSVTATVDIGGFDPSCDRTKSATSMIEKKPEPTKSDEYSSTEVKLETERLDRFAQALMNDPMVSGYVVSYGGRVGKNGEAQVLADQSKNYLVRRGIEAGRLVTVDGGFREQLTIELWLVPPGAAIPQPTPTVKADEVQPLKETPKPATKTPARSKPRKG